MGSSLDTGTIFVVHTPASRDRISRIVRDMTSPATVLLVDDEVPFVQAMTKRLTKRNIPIVTAYNGLEALSLLQERVDVDVVILDVRMPGMDGISVLREIKQKAPLVEVIMLTGHATVESAIEGMRLGAFDYLMKPCDLEKLMNKIAAAKQRKTSHEERITRAESWKAPPSRSGN